MSKIHHYRHFTKFTRSDKKLPKSESERLSHDLNTVPIITSTHVELLEWRGGKLLTKLSCCVGERYKMTNWYNQLS